MNKRKWKNNFKLINRIISRLLLDLFFFELFFIVTKRTKHSRTSFKQRAPFLSLVLEYKNYIINLNNQTLLISRSVFPLYETYSSLLSITKNLFRINKSIDYLLIGLIDHRSRFFSCSKYLTSQLNCLDKLFWEKRKKYIFTSLFT